MDEDARSEDGPWTLIVIGLLMIGGAWWLHSLFTGLEQSGGSMRINWMFALLYKAFGKWAVVGIIGLSGATFVRMGFKKMGSGE